MTDTKTTLTWLLRDQVSGTAHKIDQELKGAAASGTGAGGAFGKLGGALVGMISPMNLAIGGLGLLAAGGTMAVKKAMDHEVQLKKLDATLLANVQSYNGNRDAIDAYISKQTDAGFTVDETTNSLAQLVTATGDVQKAEEFQAAAEDLARLKGISLADATDAMTKIEAGRFRGLANLGIVLQKGATVTDALRAVQKVAAGQADAYGKTMEGSFSKMNAKFDEAMTKVGQALLPVLTALASFFVDVLVPAIGKVIGVISTLIGWIVDAIKWFTSLFDSESKAAKIAAGGGAGKYAPPPRRAMGGPVEAGGVYTVGENGPETLVMGQQNGTVLPHGAGMSGLAPVEIPVMIGDREIGRVVDKRLFVMLAAAGGSRRFG